MHNIEYIKYTYKHRKIVIKLAEKYFKDDEELLEKIQLHDLDKLFLYLFYDKKSASKIHRDMSSHHENELEKTKLDYIEMVLDWESARYTKPDKPLNAFETLKKYYPDMEKEILPILKNMGIDKENIPMDEEILLLAKELEEIDEEEIIDELKYFIDLISSKKKKRKK